jgi:hypothetical protein
LLGVAQIKKERDGGDLNVEFTQGAAAVGFFASRWMGDKKMWCLLWRERKRERERGGEGRGSESKKSYQRRWKEAACRKGLYLGDLLFCPHLGRTNILEHAILFFHSRFLGNSATHLSGASKNRAEREKS